MQGGDVTFNIHIYMGFSRCLHLYLLTRLPSRPPPPPPQPPLHLRRRHHRLHCLHCLLHHRSLHHLLLHPPPPPRPPLPLSPPRPPLLFPLLPPLSHLFRFPVHLSYPKLLSAPASLTSHPDPSMRCLCCVSPPKIPRPSKLLKVLQAPFPPALSCHHRPSLPFPHNSPPPFLCLYPSRSITPS